eukprot:3756716-Pyramimonas_sp.AAC.1
MRGCFVVLSDHESCIQQMRNACASSHNALTRTPRLRRESGMPMARMCNVNEMIMNTSWDSSDT